MAENNTPQIIQIDGAKYDLADFSDNAKAQLQGLQAAETEIKRLNMQLALAQTAGNAYMQALQADLPEAIDQ